MTNEPNRQRMRELGRAGGLASAEARRRRKLRSVADEALEQINADPRSFVAGILGSTNSSAKVRLLELAQGWKQAGMLEQEAELLERDRRLREAERALEHGAEWNEMEAASVRRAIEAGRAELVELERVRSELRSIVEREAHAHGLEVHDAEA